MQDSDPRSRLLLVEGQDDKHVVLQLRDRHGIPSNFCIKEKTNNDQLLKSIRGEARAPGRTALGIVLDANDNPDARWQAVTDRLRTLGEEGFSQHVRPASESCAKRDSHFRQASHRDMAHA